MRGVVAVLAVAGCGRVHFGPLATTDTDAAVMSADASDGAMIDAEPPPLPQGLVARYPFEDPGIFADVVTGELSTCAPVSTCPAYTPGHTGAGLLFDGTDDCLTVTDDGRFQLPQFTLAVWARQDVAGTLSHVSKRTVGGSANSWQLETDPLGGDPGTISLTTYSGSGVNEYAISPLNVVTIGQWHHVAGTFDGSVKRVYLDGAEVTFVTGVAAIVYDSMDVKIGCDDNAPPSRFWTGALDELQVYDRALDASEIADLAAR